MNAISSTPPTRQHHHRSSIHPFPTLVLSSLFRQLTSIRRYDFRNSHHRIPKCHHSSTHPFPALLPSVTSNRRVRLSQFASGHFDIADTPPDHHPLLTPKTPNSRIFLSYANHQHHWHTPIYTPSWHLSVGTRHGWSRLNAFLITPTKTTSCTSSSRYVENEKLAPVINPTPRLESCGMPKKWKG